MSEEKKPLRMVELILDEENIVEGVQAMGVVTKPAIMTNFVAFKDESGHEFVVPKKTQFAELSADKKILLRPAMIPNLPIIRLDDEGNEYYNYYTSSTVEKAMQLFMKNGRQNSATLEHEVGVSGMTIVESWIVEDEEKDKSRLYGFDVPKGTWMISMKVYDEEILQSFIKTGVLQGFSIEVFFSDSEMIKQKEQVKRAIQNLAKLRATKSSNR